MGLYSINSKKKVEAFINRHPDPVQTRRDLEQFYANTPSMYGVRVNDQFVMIESITSHILDTSEVVWAYHYSNQIRYGGLIPMGSTHAIILRTKDGGSHNAVVPTKAAAEKLLKFLFERLPRTYFGYHQKVVELWKQTEGEHHETFAQLGMAQHGK